MDYSVIEECRRLVNLGPWLERCEGAGVAFIPATFSEAFRAEEIHRACAIIESGDALTAEHAPGLVGAFWWLEGQMEDAVRAGRRMVARWECCMPERMKWMMGRGMRWDEQMRNLLTLDDPRLEDCIASEELRICVRPWVEARREGGYPVEFRVFYGTNGLQGVSSYYPQRALAHDAVNEMLADMCVLRADLFFGRERFPVGFTADFLVDENFEVWFLEGGPPHIKGCPVSAHPCCFEEGEVRGVALSSR